MTGLEGRVAVVHTPLVEVHPEPLYISNAAKVVLYPTCPVLGADGLVAVVHVALVMPFVPEMTTGIILFLYIL
jgi:hypothetical protein